MKSIDTEDINVVCI